MFIKILGSLMIIISTTILGNIYSARYRQRLVQLRQLKSAIREIESQIVFFAVPIPEVLKKMSIQKNDISIIFERVNKLMINNREITPGEAFERVFSNKIRGIFLNRDDIEILKSFTKLLGTSDISGQKNSIEMIKNQLDNQEISAEQEKNKYEKMYKSIGILSGLAIAIVLF